MKNQLIKDLKNGQDFTTRDAMSSSLLELVSESDKGNISLADYIERLETIVNEAKQLISCMPQ